MKFNLLHFYEIYEARIFRNLYNFTDKFDGLIDNLIEIFYAI